MYNPEQLQQNEKSGLISKIRFRWPGVDYYQSLLYHSFKHYLTTDHYAEKSQQQREECLLYMEQLSEMIQDIDNEISQLKNNST